MVVVKESFLEEEDDVRFEHHLPSHSLLTFNSQKRKRKRKRKKKKTQKTQNGSFYFKRRIIRE